MVQKVANRTIASVGVTTAPVIGKFNLVQGSSLLATPTGVGDSTLTVLDGTAFNIGTYVVMYCTTIDRYYVGYVLSKSNNVLTVDTPLDAVYPIGSLVGAGRTNMNIDGSTTSKIFGIRGPAVENPLNLVFDITRIIFQCQTSSAVDLSKFGDLTALSRGLILRRRNGDYNNIFNVKTNGDIAGICFDWYPYASTNPTQGQDGFSAGLSFGGLDRMGTILRLREGEDLEFIIQDNLTGLSLLEVIAEGHIADV